ncbi:MAG: membrane protein insertion efficiency factor YidD [Actinomycetes bacterium]
MRKFAIQILGLYQKWISPMFPPRCKYYPSCSAYAITAISRYGLKGLLMSAWRLLRCNPWSHGGVDYVPEKKTIFNNHDNLVIKGVNP